MDPQEFEKEWEQISKEICDAVYNHPEVIKIRRCLEKNGFLTLEEKSSFINISDKTKYDIIYKKYGHEGSEGYKEFSGDWEKWFQEKGVESQKGHDGKSNVEHIMFGSTPDPVKFLKRYKD